ncbi:MAG: L-serine ammonia-lyase, iron-sulfur-dependent, subunit alpha [Candidatus Treponema excrementipullorum]|nr:L-serine ammonia-lyase, iron-sulfur-dependent, subunit alpha [Spirochaetia bacterium]MCI7589296.1 L-serine ammonia-lyase, iron-sulfur-dependent, subunit alpha [Spirochaetia bacterium]MDD7011498.1 L-serine ammonia-lyase, iron-sulfur-dependent, subunit alpha [Candidatus Treponema excrementipullorum]MDY2755250.1 L-serine ammonia-lyase, iron-sulfur-dependent, subunit alpha [Candidatus Treponema excrementipullorum]MDY4466614.1 L-serine ammonia-lyase, iron-sulfur-dependent, subunit alpha [Candidat
MTETQTLYKNYDQILHEELLPAMGCTEPIAIAYGSAKAREILGELPLSVLIEASGNIIKNVKSVVVPNTRGLKGIEAATAAGVIAGDSSKILEVISQVSQEQRIEIQKYLSRKSITVKPADSDKVFDIIFTLQGANSKVVLRICDYHTNITYIEKDGIVLQEAGKILFDDYSQNLTDRSLLTVEKILQYINSGNLHNVEHLIRRQIEYNYAIAEEGISHNWGANIGKVLLYSCGNSVDIRARAMAAAGSDARMSGCELPVIIVSGSGNQGITACVPVVVYARHLQVSPEKEIQAVALSDLLTIHLKTGIGRLSAYCGAVSAACAAAAAIAWLQGGSYDEIAHTLVNSLAIASGIICDGAKPSCAAKIALAIEGGLLGYKMYKNGQEFYGGEGIVTKGVENTIKNIGRLGHEGMKETDKEIIRIMTGL